MAKIKTKKAAAKRFKLTKRGVLIRGRQMGRHLRLKKSKSRIRRMKEPTRITGRFTQKIKKLIPYA
jgi:large subunit ribosomal protein L35